MLVVHGGGKIFTATLKRMGIESRFVNGLRVTDRETRDVAVMVMGGLLNKRMAGADFGGGPAGGRAVRVGRRLLSGRADDARRGGRRAGICGLFDRRQRGISGDRCGARASCRWRRAWAWAPTANSTTSMRTTWRRRARNTFTPTG